MLIIEVLPALFLDGRIDLLQQWRLFNLPLSGRVRPRLLIGLSLIGRGSPIELVFHILLNCKLPEELLEVSKFMIDEYLLIIWLLSKTHLLDEIYESREFSW